MYCNQFVAAIKINGETVREVNEGLVYIPFGTEYQIFLKNLSNRKCLVDIEIDGDDVLSGNRIIVPSNDSTTLEGFMKRSGKISNNFKFIEKTNKIREYRGEKAEDGLIRISFQFEQNIQKVPRIYPTDEKFIPIDPGPWYRLPKKSYDWGYDPYDSGLRVTCNNQVGQTEADKQCHNEEGVTTKGDLSNQNFYTGSHKNLESTKHVIVFRLKGKNSKKKVKKPVLTRKKIKCPMCGTDNISANKFCFECGTCLI